MNSFGLRCSAITGNNGMPNVAFTSRAYEQIFKNQYLKFDTKKLISKKGYTGYTTIFLVIFSILLLHTGQVPLFLKIIFAQG